MYKFEINFTDEDIRTLCEDLDEAPRWVIDFLNNLQTESESPRGKDTRLWILSRLWIQE